MKETLRTALEKSRTLYSIFDRVEVKNHKFRDDCRAVLPKVVLQADGLAAGFNRTLDTDLRNLFEADLKLLQNIRDTAQADTLPYLFQKYGWRIAAPADPAQYPDEAFCDQFRATQAMEKPGPSGGYLLVKGDLTGIQEYIYHNIQGKKTGGLSKLAKRLRARSVLVSLLADFVANVILRELGLSSWHLLFAGGGHFNLLLPDDREADLLNLAPNVNAALRHQFGERLELILAWKNYDRTTLESNVSKCFAAVNSKRDELKYRQHLGWLNDLFAEEIQQNIEKREQYEQQIGGEFPKQTHLLEVVSESPLTEYKSNLMLTEFKLSAYHTLLAVKEDSAAHAFLLKNKDSSIQSAHLLALNNTNFMPSKDWKSDFDFPISFGFRFLGKNAPVDDSGRVLEFSELAGKDKSNPKSDGFTRLGALMLDVDDLGLIFGHGIKGASLAQIITLSRELNYFFTAHFNKRAQESQIYVVYSGGDDAFAVGKWDKIMHFAKTLRADFQKFICHQDNRNSDVHFSAGIFMSNPHYPIGRFYRDTKGLQDQAKDSESKNRVSVFDYTLHWDSYEDKLDLGNEFRDALQKGQTNGGRKFNSSFAYRIMQLVKSSYYERNEWVNGEFHRRGHLRPDKFARNIARMHYLFARNGFSDEDSQKITDALEKRLMHSFLKNAMRPEDSGGFEARDYLVALNFAMLQVRSTSKNI